jgi:hypothetical protein
LRRRWWSAQKKGLLAAVEPAVASGSIPSSAQARSSRRPSVRVPGTGAVSRLWHNGQGRRLIGAGWSHGSSSGHCRGPWRRSRRSGAAGISRPLAAGRCAAPATCITAADLGVTLRRTANKAACLAASTSSGCAMRYYLDGLRASRSGVSQPNSQVLQYFFERDPSRPTAILSWPVYRSVSPKPALFFSGVVLP